MDFCIFSCGTLVKAFAPVIDDKDFVCSIDYIVVMERSVRVKEVGLSRHVVRVKPLTS